MIKVDSFNPGRASASDWLPISQEVPYPNELVLSGEWKGEVRWLGKGETADWYFESAVHRASDDITIQTRAIEPWEFFYISSGAFTVELDSGEKRTFSAGDAVHLERGLLSRNTYHAPFEQMIVIARPSPAAAKPPTPRMLSISRNSSPANWPEVRDHQEVLAGTVLEGEWSGRFEFLRNTPDLYSGIYATDTSVKLDVLKTGCEFVHIIEGEIHVDPRDGDAKVFHAGESVFFPAGYAGKIAYEAPFRQMVTMLATGEFQSLRDEASSVG